jgi:hypothetical protein
VRGVSLILLSVQLNDELSTTSSEFINHHDMIVSKTRSIIPYLT